MKEDLQRELDVKASSPTFSLLNSFTSEGCNKTAISEIQACNKM